MSEKLPPLHDYSDSRAIIIGTWDYTDERLSPLPAAQYSVNRMTNLLTGELCGWPSDRITTLYNRKGPGTIPDQLVSLFKNVKDIALFYYVGHGQIGPEDQLCLGLSGSRTEPHRRATTSLEFDDVRKALRSSDAAFKIVILDCCFAGLATRPENTLAPTGTYLFDQTGGTGAYTMAATSPFSTATFETDSPAPQTYFTKYFADAVESGIPDERAGLRLHPLFVTVRENLARDGRPTPHERIVNHAHDFVFAHNVAVRPADTPSPADVAAARERDQLRLRIEELEKVITTIADAFTGAAGRAARVEEEDADEESVSSAATAEKRAGMRKRITKLEKAVEALWLAVPEGEFAAPTAMTAPTAAAPTAPPRPTPVKPAGQTVPHGDPVHPEEAVAGFLDGFAEETEQLKRSGPAAPGGAEGRAGLDAFFEGFTEEVSRSRLGETGN